MSSSPPLVLTFAASDPTGGAGLQADLLTLAALGCHPLTVVTALTVQDTRGVDAIDPIDAAVVERQAAALLAEMKVAAFKIGVLGSEANARAVAAIVASHPRVPLVVDPVLASGRGDPLAGDALIAALLELVMPRATLATPNSVEARRLGGERALLDRGCRYVLVTGTHEQTSDVVNTLYDADGKVREDRWPRLPGSYHGSGCTLASAAAAQLAHGLQVSDAVRAAQEFTWRSLSSAFRPANAQFIPNRFFSK
jgi:hydroxymethylpyrimidine/phosphomethylpyrimidine kinase